jgi:hypothetical protein
LSAACYEPKGFENGSIMFHLIKCSVQPMTRIAHHPKTADQNKPINPKQAENQQASYLTVEAKLQQE